MTEDDMALPEMVWCISMWWRWASAVRYGYKDIETRKWEWKHGPAWVVIHAAKQPDGPIVGRVEPFPDVPSVTPGALCCLAHVSGCRPLELADRERALVYAPGLWAFPIDATVPLRPIAMPGPRRLARIRREIVLDALEGVV